MKSHRIEDLKVWSKSMALVKEVYLVISELPDEEKIWFNFSDEKMCCFNTIKYCRRSRKK